VEFFLKSLAINPDFQHSNYYLKKIPTDTDFDYWRTTREFRDWFAGYQR